MRRVYKVENGSLKNLEVKEKDNIEELIWETKQYYLQHIKKDLYCWFIEIEEKVVAVASMCTFCRNSIL